MGDIHLGGVQISNDLWGVPLAILEDDRTITVEYVNYIETLIMDVRTRTKRITFNKSMLNEKELNMIRSCKGRYSCQK